MQDPAGTEYELVALRDVPRVAAHFSALPDPGDRVDNLAQRYYRDPLLFWKILDAADHLDPFDAVVPGQPLTIPPNK